MTCMDCRMLQGLVSPDSTCSDYEQRALATIFQPLNWCHTWCTQVLQTLWANPQCP